MSDQIPLLDVDPSARRAFDHYPTPRWMTQALFRRVSVFDVLEPCSGENAIVDALRAEGVKVVATNDFDERRPSTLHLDATLRGTWERLCPRPYTAAASYWGVTNVPFNIADLIVPLAVEYLPAFATILRLSWLEPTQARQRFLAEHPPTRLIVLPRHDWRGDGQTDSVTSAWFVWESGRGNSGVEVVTTMERDELIARNTLAERRVR